MLLANLQRCPRSVEFLAGVEIAFPWFDRVTRLHVAANKLTASCSPNPGLGIIDPEVSLGPMHRRLICFHHRSPLVAGLSRSLSTISKPAEGLAFTFSDSGPAPASPRQDPIHSYAHKGQSGINIMLLKGLNVRSFLSPPLSSLAPPIHGLCIPIPQNH